jgi:hypothetical protein
MTPLGAVGAAYGEDTSATGRVKGLELVVLRLILDVDPSRQEVLLGKWGPPVDRHTPWHPAERGSLLLWIRRVVTRGETARPRIQRRRCIPRYGRTTLD